MDSESCTNHDFCIIFYDSSFGGDPMKVIRGKVKITIFASFCMNPAPGDPNYHFQTAITTAQLLLLLLLPLMPKWYAFNVRSVNPSHWEKHCFTHFQITRFCITLYVFQFQERQSKHWRPGKNHDFSMKWYVFKFGSVNPKGR